MITPTRSTVFKSGKTEISTNIPGFKWPTPEEKIDGLLSAGLIDTAEAERLRAAIRAIPTTEVRHG